MNLQITMEVDELDIALLSEIEEGLPFCARPYARIGENLKISEDEVISRLTHMLNSGIIRRFGLVLQHHSLGYRANAMVVWNVPDNDVDAIARKIITHDFVTLCYSRKRYEPTWPYNLYCMIHGKERALVEQQIELVKKASGLAAMDSRTLFSRRRFKQTGARFSCTPRPQRTGI